MAGFRRRRWREGIAVRVDLSVPVAAAGGVDGLAPGELGALAPTLTEARALLAARRAAAGPLVPRREVLAPVLDDAAAARTEFDTLVVLGTGTLARAVEAVAAALPEAPGTGLRLVAAHSIDPLSVHELLARVDPRRTLFDVVSRSGETAETLAQFLLVRDRLLRDLGALDYKRHLLVTTDAERGPLRQIVNDEGFRSLPAAADLPAGRALLSPAGLFPLAAAGIDVEELLAGAAFMEARGHAAEPPLVLFVRLEDHGAGVDIPAAYQDLPEVGYLGGHSLADLCNAAHQAAAAVFAHRRQPSATLTLPALNPFTMGQLVALLQSLVAARDCLAGSDAAGEAVDRRRLLAGILGRRDLEAERAWVAEWLAQKDPRLVL